MNKGKQIVRHVGRIAGILLPLCVVVFYAIALLRMSGRPDVLLIVMGGILLILSILMAIELLLDNQKQTLPEHLISRSAENKEIIELLTNLNNNASFQEMLEYIHSSFSDYIPYNYIGVAVIDPEKQSIQAFEGVSDGTTKGLPFNLAGRGFLLSDTSLQSVLESNEARIINDLEAYTGGKPLSLYNKIILRAGIRSSITLPLKLGDEALGLIFFSSTKKNVYTQEHGQFLKMLASGISVSFSQNIFIHDLLYGSTLALAKLAEARDEDTGEHLYRMQEYSKVITEYLLKDHLYLEEVDYTYVRKVERFSPLHDIGKVGIRDSVLLKPGKLTTEEFEEIKLHAKYGADVMRAAEYNLNKHGKSLYLPGIEIAEGHHERWDGTGYPYGKKGLEIPLSARIVAVADVFDALTSKRPYKEAYSFDRAFQMILDSRGSHFDPVIIDCLERHRDHFYALYRTNQ